jgi:hypothetical protein
MEQLKIDKQHEELARLVGHIILGNVEIERVMAMTGQYMTTIHLPISREVTFEKPTDPPIYSPIESEAVDLNRIALPVFLGSGLFSMGYGPETQTLVLHGNRNQEADRMRDELAKIVHGLNDIARLIRSFYGIKETTDALQMIEVMRVNASKAITRVEL